MNPSKIKKAIARATFTSIAAIGALLLLALISFAIYDSVSSVHADSQRVQQSTLAAELSNFILSVRDADGTSLLDNPKEFSAAQRPLRPVTIKRSFYSYLLNRGNARTFTVEKLVWEPPRSCTLLFEKPTASHRAKNDEVTVQACFAVVQDDPAGRYIYFTLRYPAERLRQHARGQDLVNSDRIVLDFLGDRQTQLTLVYESPVLAASRYPSQMKRFDGLHEVSAFLGNSPAHPTRQVNAQAFERRSDTVDNRNFVTILGRIDAGLVDWNSAGAAQWPTDAAKRMLVGIEIYEADQNSSSKLIFKAPTGTSGEALASLQKAYISNVPSGAKIAIAVPRKDHEDLVWSTDMLALPEQPRRRDWTQRLSDWWAPQLMGLLGKPYGGSPVTTLLQFGSIDGQLTARATLAPAPLPDVATRAFGWLSAAFLLTLVLVLVGGFAIVRLLRVTRSAWSRVVSMNYTVNKREYGRKRDEISTLGRVFNLLLARARSRNAHLVRRLAHERSDLLFAQEHLALRHDRLDAIGHEIRSPLQALMSRTKGDAELQARLQRMQRAIEALFDAESVEDGIGGLEVVLSRVDIAIFLTRLVEAKKALHPYLSYVGPPAGVFVLLDDIQFEQVIDHLIDNAERYRTLNGGVAVRLRDEGEDIVIEVFNEGSPIAVDRLDSIFKYRNSDRLTPRNRGQGLFAARKYLLAMKATIRAENQPQGVSMVIRIRRAEGPGRS